MSLYEIKQAGVPNVSFVLHEETSRYSRDVAVVPANTPAMVAGTVLGKVTASGKLKPYSNAATDGSEAAVGILLYNTPRQTEDQKVTVLTRHAEVNGNQLVGVDAAAIADLKQVGILVRY